MQARIQRPLTLETDLPCSLEVHVEMVQVVGEAREEPQGIQDGVEEAGVAEVSQRTHPRDPPSTVP